MVNWKDVISKKINDKDADITQSVSDIIQRKASEIVNKFKRQPSEEDPTIRD